jgi:hypothetical protein
MIRRPVGNELILNCTKDDKMKNTIYKNIS